ncbi:MAG: hypothetical protein AB8B47_03845 [Roseobacter sp.]
MPLQNRVQPDGEIIAHPTYGAYMGNRGILHDAHRTLGTARWRLKAWVTCRLEFKGRNRTVMSPRRYTELFFFDEAVAFAAGHRPCAECRRDHFNTFKQAAVIKGKIKSFDDDLHRHRAHMRPYRQRRVELPLDDLPDGTFVQTPTGQSALVLGDALVPFAPSGYQPRVIRPRGITLPVLTPVPLINALRGGYLLDMRVPD